MDRCYITQKTCKSGLELTQLRNKCQFRHIFKLLGIYGIKKYLKASEQRRNASEFIIILQKAMKQGRGGREIVPA